MVPDMPVLRLPDLPFHLPEQVGRPDVELYHRLTQTLEREVIQGGSPSGIPSGRMAALMRCIEADERSPEALLRGPGDIRVLITWWRGDPNKNLRLLPLTKALMQHCIQLKPRFSLQALFGLLNLFFEEFDRISQLEILSETLKQQLERRKRDGSGRGSLAPLILNRRHLFLGDGPERVVSMARSKGQTLDAFADAQGIPVEARGRFYECCQQFYYLETLDGLEVGEDHEILHELARIPVHGMGFQDGLLLGHEVIRRIVDKAADHAQLPDNWLHLILTIACDPRVSVSSQCFTKWWARLDRKYHRKVRSWLSRMDLGLFLAVLEDYSNQAGDEMRRMFPARERFLRGLFKAELIKDSRLFLGRHADEFVRDNYRNQEVPNYATNTDAEKSVFYLNIGDGGLHVFEGTHSFYFWIYRDLPKNNPSENYEVNTFPIRDLGMGLKELTERETGKQPFHVAHNGNWQHAVIEEFRHLGIDIDPATVLTEDDYRIYRRKYGIY